jgi:hypothetical protein
VLASTGRPVFLPEIIREATESARSKFAIVQGIGSGWEPRARLALEGTKWRPHTRGELFTYHPHDHAETYYIGADVGMGVSRDWSVAQVQDSKRRQVAVFRAQVDPDYFATVLLHLGQLYNDARIIVESNNHGILTCTRLGKDFGYPNFYTEMVYDKLTDTETVRLGFQTNVRTKPLIVDKLRASVRDNEIELNDYVTLEEMRSFVVTQEGKMEAEKGCHDDAVMALALVNHINEGSFEPIINYDTYYLKLE